ncbi:MAG: radical SAM protein, partial [Nitrospinales bacterium]
RDFTPELIRAYRNLDVLADHLHLPVQSGNNRILKAMRRGYTVEDYFRLVDALKAEVPGIALSTDIIVGFPGETDREFRETLRLMERVGFDNSYMFVYSPRPGTAAAELADTVPENVKKDRLQATIELQKSITEKNGGKYVGGEVEVLIEGGSARDGADFKGRSPHYWMVHFAGGGGALKPGDRVPVKVRDVAGHVLLGSYSPPRAG